MTSSGGDVASRRAELSTLRGLSPPLVDTAVLEPLQRGQIVDGKYELVCLLARGGMGEVWVARHRTLGEEVALKVPVSDDADPASFARLCLEARVSAHLSAKTAHVVRVTDLGHHGPLPYLAMELLLGESLESEIASLGVLPPERVAEIVSQVARALEVAHAEGVLHRDLKPANVFLAKDERGALLVKVLDFGVACAPHGVPYGGLRVTAAGKVVGTPEYMSPEQARACPEVDLRCDLWALAATAYEALTGEPPVGGRDLTELLRNLVDGRILAIRERRLPGALAAFFDRAFAPRAEDRFRCASELALAFRRAVSGAERPGKLAPPVPVQRPAESPIPIPARRARATPRARRALVLVAAVALLPALGAVSWSRPAHVSANMAPERPRRTLATRPARSGLDVVLVPASPAPHVARSARPSRSPAPTEPPPPLPPVVNRSSVL